MADQKQLEILEQGAKAWNQWRGQNEKVLPDLSGVDLSGVDLSGADLGGACLINADLSGVDLSGACLAKAHLDGTDLSGVNLSGVNLGGVDLSGVNLNGVNLSGADLGGADLSGVNLSGVDLGGADLGGADLSGVNLSGVNLSGVCLIKANLDGANLSRARLVRGYLGEANLINANLSGADLSGADLSETNLSRAGLGGVNLNGADLSGADLSSADLGGANLSKANLSRANLSRANLSRANLREANLREANLKEADFTLSVAIATDFTKATLTNACIENWNFNSETIFAGAQCESIFRETDKGKYINRLPRDPNTTFKPGEFEVLIRQTLHSIDLVFVDGLDWQAFFQSFQELRNRYQDNEIDIQGIERKGKSFFIRLETAADPRVRGIIKATARGLYEEKLALAEARYKTELDIKDETIAACRLHNINMTEIAKSLAEVRRITSETKGQRLEPESSTDVRFTTGDAVRAPQANTQITNDAPQYEKHWNYKWWIGFFVALAGTIGAWFAVPEFRCWLGDTSSCSLKPQPGSNDRES